MRRFLLAWVMAYFVSGATPALAQSVQCLDGTATQSAKSAPSAPGNPAPRAPSPAVPDITVSCGTSNNAQTVNRDSGAPAEKPSFALQVLEALTRFLGVVLWPLLLFAFLLLFRKPITRLIDRIKSLSWGDKGAEFAEAVEEADEKAEIESSPEVAMFAVREAAAAARKDPRTAILEAWLQVEQAIKVVIAARNLGTDFTRIQNRPFTALRLIQQAGLIDQKYVTLFQDLRTLRNQAAHAPQFSPPLESVIRYVELAQELTQELRRRA